MDLINWEFILSHPSEFVRIDEQLRLLQIQLSAYKEQFLTESILQEIHEHENILIGFRDAVNIFGCHIFGVEILSDEEAAKKNHSLNQPQSNGANFFQEYTNMTREMFRKLIDVIEDKRNTEKVFRQFLIVIFDNYINVGDNHNPHLNSEKEKIMHEIINRVHC